MIYANRHVCAAAGVPAATLRNWMVRGLVEPEFPSGGKGKPAQFSRQDLMTAVALARLRDMGLHEASGLAEEIGREASTYMLLATPGVVARPSVEERPWRLYWTWTPHGWRHSTEPDPTHPTITIDAAGMAEDAMQRLYEEYPETEERTTE